MTTGIEGSLVTPGSPEWLQTISASKVAAIVGLNPWTSRFTLWHEMKGNVARETTDVHRRGHYLEPAIKEWLADQHSDWDLFDTGTWTHHDIPWATASPDGVFYRSANADGDWIRSSLVEVKSAADGAEWGTPGTDQIPPYYRAQCQWQMFVTGMPVTHVGVLLPYLTFAEYVVEYDEAEAVRLYDAAVAFRQSLADNVQPPLDSANDTYQTVRSLHPDIEDETAEIDPNVAWEWLLSREALDEAKADEQVWRSVIVDAMGSAHYAESNGYRLGDRRAKGEGVPYFQPARNLPTSDTFTTKDAA